MTVTATWFPIFQQHTEMSQWNSRDFLSNYALSNPPTPSITLTLITAHSNCDCVDGLVFAHVQYCVAMSGVCATWWVEVSCELACARLCWTCADTFISLCVCVWTGQPTAAGNAHWPQWEEPRSIKVRSKQRSDLLLCGQTSVSTNEALSLILHP